MRRAGARRTALRVERSDVVKQRGADAARQRVSSARETELTRAEREIRKGSEALREP